MSFSNFNAGGAVAQSQNNPVYSLPHLYINGMNISCASTTVLAISPGSCRDSNNVMDLEIAYPNLQGNTLPAVLFQGVLQALYIDSTVNGAGGLDTGTIAASTQYAVYVIGDSRGYNNTAGIISLTSAPAPLLPNGYDSLRLIGFIETDASSHFVYATHQPQSMSAALSYYLKPVVSVLAGGNATSFTAIDMSTPIPTTTLDNVIVDLLVTFTPAAVGDVVKFRPTGSTATSNVTVISGVAANVAQTQYIQMVAGVGSSKPEIDYLVSTSSDSVSVSVLAWTGVPHTAYPT